MDPAWLNFVTRNFFAIIVRYSFIFNTLVQYFVVLGNLIFHHFRSISNKLKTRAGFVSVSDVPTKIASLYNFLQYLNKYAFVRRATRRFWKVPWQTNPNLLNKRHLKFACAYHNTQESSPSGTPLKRL
ncbi:hypothetical protein T08_2220 [Trichinella sp. T8]|nr:hypothetical protein T08_2220 [Trichinella sp. T8]